MKMKVVIKVSMNDQRTRKKALKTVVSCLGVESAAVKGKDRDLVEVIGEGIDAVKITTSLRKHVGCSEIVSVGSIGDDKKEDSKPAESPVIWNANPYGYSTCNYNIPYEHCYEVRDSSSDPCTIM